MRVGGAGRYTRLIRINSRSTVWDEKNMAVIEGLPPNGFLQYCFVLRCIRNQGECLLERVIVYEGWPWGSTVYRRAFNIQTQLPLIFC